MHIALASIPGGVVASDLSDTGEVRDEEWLEADDVAEWVAMRELERPRWVWSDTSRWYPSLLAAGVRIERCHDLRLCHTILRNAADSRASALATAPESAWDAPPATIVEPAAPTAASDPLFDLDGPDGSEQQEDGLDPIAEFALQQRAVAQAPVPGRLARLLAAESVGSLVAAEMTFAGLPWSVERHERLLAELLGPRPAIPGSRPEKLEAKLADLRRSIDDPGLNPDSPVELLRGLQSAGIRTESTRSWELKQIEHPAIAPLLEYKKLARLLSANGWHWLDTWVRDGRFRSVYVPGGVVTGRWASDGGGALQLPKQIRGAVVADPGWTFVVADAAQLEPRVLAALSGDEAMARAGREADMYEGIVGTGAVTSREEAKYGMLGAIYGGTSGVSGRVLPRITRAFPLAMGLVEEAARAGERGESVQTRLGRTSPPGRAAGYDETLSAAEQRNDQVRRRSWGRFTRNFVVQGTAAEWALCWMGGLRGRLWQIGGGAASDAPVTARPHLVFFLHDELIVHTPIEHADAVAAALRESAADAGRLLFGQVPVEFPVSVATVDVYADAK